VQNAIGLYLRARTSECRDGARWKKFSWINFAKSQFAAGAVAACSPGPFATFDVRADHDAVHLGQLNGPTVLDDGRPPHVIARPTTVSLKAEPKRCRRSSSSRYWSPGPNLLDPDICQNWESRNSGSVINRHTACCSFGSRCPSRKDGQNAAFVHCTQLSSPVAQFPTAVDAESNRQGDRSGKSP